jgi:hypothetical protein
MNIRAPEGQIFVCSACGKRSKDKYGDEKIDQYWDVSCVINAVLCYEEKNSDGSYVAVLDDGTK